MFPNCNNSVTAINKKDMRMHLFYIANHVVQYLAKLEMFRFLAPLVWRVIFQVK